MYICNANALFYSAFWGSKTAFFLRFCKIIIKRIAVNSFFSRIQVRLLLLVLLVLLPFLGKTVLDYQAQRQQAIEAAEASVRHFSNMAAKNQEYLFEEARQLLVMVAQAPEVVNYDEAKCGDLLAGLRRQFPIYVNIGVVDQSGALVCDAIGTPNGANLAESFWFKRTLDTEEYVTGDYSISPFSGKPVFSSSYPFYNENGALQGVVFAELDLRWLDTYVVEADLPEGSTLLISDQDGMVYARYPETDGDASMQLPDGFSNVLALIDVEGVYLGEGEDGRSWIYGFSQLCCLPWQTIYIIVGVPNEVALAEATSRLTSNLLVFGLIAVLGFAASGIGAEVLILRPLRNLMKVIKRLDQGDYTTRAQADDGSTEIIQIAEALNNMADAVEAREEEHELLLEQTISAQEDERKRIARELHDSTTQDIAALLLNLDACEMELDGQDPMLQQRIHASRDLAGQTLADLRRMMNDLRPTLLDDMGLASAIKWYGEQRLGDQGIDFAFICDDATPQLPAYLETTLYRVIQEAINNVVRHAHATCVRASMHVNDRRQLVLTVSDDGRGFDASAMQNVRADGSGLGLRGMRERVAMIDGTLNITSSSQGTTVTLAVPLPEENQAHGQESGNAPHGLQESNVDMPEHEGTEQGEES